jgi:hypothetical protein
VQQLGLECFYPKNICAGTSMLDFSLEVEAYSAPADAGLMTFVRCLLHLLFADMYRPELFENNTGPPYHESPQTIL